MTGFSAVDDVTFKGDAVTCHFVPEVATPPTTTTTPTTTEATEPPDGKPQTD